MIFKREGYDTYIISPENTIEREQLEKSLGWKGRKLEHIICQLKGYVSEEEK